jgi:hypothetical protein
MKMTGFYDRILDTISVKTTSKQDRYHDAIVAAFKLHSATTDRPVKFKDIYYNICINLGATPEDALMGIAPCPYENTRKDIKGLIRSWVEERSPHSRQHYWRGGKRVHWTNNERPLLFVNWGLANANTQVEWMPYNHVRGNGWIFDPVAASAWIKPNEEILERATTAYRKIGMQGNTNRTINKADVIKVKREYKIKKIAKNVMENIRTFF